MINSRKDKFNDLEFEYLENPSVNEDFDPEDYRSSMEIVKIYFEKDDVEQPIR